MNERIARLRAKNLTQQPEICSERAQIVTRAYEKYKDLPPLLLRAKTFEAIMQEMTIWIADDELIVGNQAKMAKGAPVYPEFSVDWIIKELDSFSTRTSSRFLLSEENKTVLRELLPKWQGRTTKDRALSIIPEAAKEAMASQAFLLSPLSSGLGHISVSYQKLIDHGIDFLLDEIREKLEHCQPTAAEDVERKVFYEACQIVLQAMLHFAERFAVLAETQAARAEGQRKDELLEIARVCRKVPRERAETFHEALQSFWFLHLCLQIDSNGHSMSPGRFDQYTWRCYENDMRRGVSPEREEELLGCLWVKFAEISKLRDYMGSLAFGGYPMFQNLIVGGMDADGNDVTNDVSVLCCKVTAELKLSQPSLSVRWHKHSARRMKLAAAEVARAGIGMPAYFNDEAIIPVLRNIGCSLAEARDYCEVGCVGWRACIPRASRTSARSSKRRSSTASIPSGASRSVSPSASSLKISPRSMTPTGPSSAISWTCMRSPSTRSNLPTTPCARRRWSPASSTTASNAAWTSAAAAPIITTPLRTPSALPTSATRCW